MVSFAEACLISALEGEAKFWITLYKAEIYNLLFNQWDYS